MALSKSGEHQLALMTCKVNQQAPVFSRKAGFYNLAFIFS